MRFYLLLAMSFLLFIKSNGQTHYILIDSVQYSQGDTLLACQQEDLNFSVFFAAGDTALYNIDGAVPDTVLVSGQLVSLANAFGNPGSVRNLLIQFSDSVGDLSFTLQAYSTPEIRTRTRTNQDSSLIVCSATVLTEIAEAGVTGGPPGARYAYRWQRSDNRAFSQNVSDVNGADSSSYPLASEGPIANRFYLRSGIYDSCASAAVVWGDAIEVKVYSPLQLNPLSSVQNSLQFSEFVCQGGSLATALVIPFQGGDSLADYHFDWEWSTASDFSSLSGTTSIMNQITLAPSDVGALSDTTYFRVRVSEGCGDTVVSSVYAAYVSDPFMLGAITYAGTAVDSDTICFQTTLPSSLKAAWSGGRAPYSFNWEWDTDTAFSNPRSFSLANNDELLAPGELGSNEDTRFIRCTATDSCGDIRQSSSVFTLVVHPELGMSTIQSSAPPLATVCNGRPIPNNLFFQPSGGDPGSDLIYSWYRSASPSYASASPIAGNDTTVLTAAALGNLSDTTHLWARVVDPNCGDTVLSDRFTVVVYDPFQMVGLHQLGNPSITSERVCYNDSANNGIQVTVNGGNTDVDLLYKWEVSTDPSFQNVSGPPYTPNLDILPAASIQALTDTTFYRVFVADGCGDTLLSNTYSFYVDAELQLASTLSTSSASATDTICFSEFLNVPIRAARSGGRAPFNYQWEVSGSISFNSSSFLVGINTDSVLTPAEIGRLDTSLYVRSVVLDGCSDQKTSSAAYYVHVYDELIAGSIGTTSPTSKVCYGRALGADLWIAPVGGDPKSLLKYEWWMHSTADTTQGQQILGADTDTLASQDIGLLTADAYIWAKVIDPNCGAVSLSDVQYIPVYDSLVLNELSSTLQAGTYSEQICYGVTIQDPLQVSHSGGHTDLPFAYRWEWSRNPSFNVLKGSISSTTSNTLTPSALGTLMDTTFVRAIAFDACGDSVVSNTYTVRVDDSLYVGAVRQVAQNINRDTVCYGDEMNFDISAAVQGGRSSFQFNWQRSSDPLFNTSDSITTDNDDAVLTSAELGPLFSTVYIRAAVLDNCGDSALAISEYTIVVHPELRVDTIKTLSTASLETVCHNDTIAEPLQFQTSGGDPVSPRLFQWFRSSSAVFSTAAPIPMANTLILSPTALGPLTQKTFVWGRSLDPSCGDTAWTPAFEIAVYQDLVIDQLSSSVTANVTNDTVCYFNSFPMDSLWVTPVGGDTSNHQFTYRWIYATDSLFQNVEQTLDVNDPWLPAHSLVADRSGTLYLKARVFDNSCHRDSSDSRIIQVEVTNPLNGGSIAFKTAASDSIEICFDELTELISVAGQAPQGGLKELNPQRYGYGYQWEIKGDTNSVFSPMPVASDSNYVLNLDSVLQPGWYSLRLKIVDDCGPFYSDSAHVWVKASPYFDSISDREPALSIVPLDTQLLDLDGSLTLCANQQNIPVRLSAPYLGSNHDYRWSADPNIPLSSFGDGQPIFHSLVQMPNLDSADLNLEILSLDSDCPREVRAEIWTSGETAPDAVQIIPKNISTTHILLAQTSMAGLMYMKWGVIDRQTATLTYVSSWDTIQFHQFDAPIDTANYTYFVANTFDTTGSCRSYSFFPSSIKAISANVTGPNEIDVKLYPNPNEGSFILTDASVSITSMKMTDLFGRQIPLRFEKEEQRWRVHVDHFRGLALLRLMTTEGILIKKVWIR